MGDLNAVDLAKEMHMGVLKAGGGMKPEHSLRYPRGIPSNPERFYEGVMIDDHVGVQIAKRGAADSREALYMDRVFDRINDVYVEVGLVAHPKKRQRNVKVAEFRGGELEGAYALHGAPRRKLAWVMVLRAELARTGICSIVVLETICGQLAYILTFRRPLMSLLFHVYRQASPDGRRDTPIKLHAWARNELLTVARFCRCLLQTFGRRRPLIFIRQTLR